MKISILAITALLAVTAGSQAADLLPVEVSIDTPSAGWSLKIKSAHTRGDKLLVVCQLTAPGGVSASVISKAKDSIQLSKELAGMKRDIYLLGKTWNWGKGYTAVTQEQLKTHLKGSKSVYTAKPGKEAAAAAEKKLKGDDTDFIGLSYKEAVALAKKRKLAQRIMMKDGKSQMGTMDFNRKRLNFTIVKGIVTAVRRG